MLKYGNEAIAVPPKESLAPPVLITYCAMLAPSVNLKDLIAASLADCTSSNSTKEPPLWSLSVNNALARITSDLLFSALPAAARFA